MSVPEKYYIHNAKKEKYTKSTFSGYKKIEVNNVLKKTILKGELDRACYWGVELDISADVFKLWDRLIAFAAKEINIASPNLPIFLWKRYHEFKNLEKNFIKYRLEIRNNQESRNKLCELITVLTLSPKKKILPLPKIKEEHFELGNMRNYMVASDLSKIQKFWKIGDPPEIRIPLNEIANFLSMNNAGSSIAEKTLFWLSWLLTWEKLHKKKFGEFKVSHRETSNINSKYTNDPIWIVWKIILEELLERREHEHFYSLKENIECLYKLYKYEYNRSKKQSRIHLVVFAILLILDTTPTIDFNTPIFYKDNLRIKAMANINDLYYTIYLNKSRPILNQQELQRQALEESPYFSNRSRENVKGFSEYLQKQTYGREILVNPNKQRVIRKKKQQKKLKRVKQPTGAGISVHNLLKELPKSKKKFTWKLFQPHKRPIVKKKDNAGKQGSKNLYKYYKEFKK